MIRDLVIGYAPLWYLLVVGLLVYLVSTRRWERRVARARRSLSEIEARAAVRPTPAPIDVEPRP